MTNALPVPGNPRRSKLYAAGAIHEPVPVGWLALVLLGTALSPRLLTALGAPAMLNFAHFAAAVLFVLIALPAIRGRAAIAIAAWLACLALVILVSALVNEAGVINALLDALLLAEPFLLLTLLVSAQPSPRYRTLLRYSLLGFGAANVAAALFQRFALGKQGDFVKGLFLDQGAGHHVAGAVALTFGAFLLTGRSRVPQRQAILAALACVAVAVLSDSKQVIVVFLAAVAGMAALRIRDPRRLVGHALIAGATLVILWLAREAFPLVDQLFLDQGRLQGGLTAKTNVLPLLMSHSESPVQALFGLGPGHTGGRLARMLPKYQDYLLPLGATISPVSSAILEMAESNPYTSSTGTSTSSAWSPFFFWAGLAGDLGLVGLITYAALWWTVWRKLCTTELARFLALTVLIFGVVYDWPEEPAYMLYVVAIIGFEWLSTQTETRDLPVATQPGP